MPIPNIWHNWTVTWTEQLPFKNYIWTYDTVYVYWNFTIYILISFVFFRFGYPKQILSDQGKEFVNKVWNIGGRIINLQESKITGRPVVSKRCKATQTQEDEFGTVGGESTVDLTILEELSLQEVTIVNSSLTISD